MERMAWTDERLDDLSQRVDSGFARLDADMRDLRVELREGLAAVRTELGGEIAAVRTELGGEIASLRATLLRVGGGIMVGLVGVIAALLAGG